MQPDDVIAAAYDRWARQYDSDRNPTRDLDALVLRRAGLRVHGRRVLELGCGTGKNTAWLIEQRPAELVAMDFSAGMLGQARERLGDAARLLRQDLREPWPLPAGCMDLVLGNLVLEHIEQLPPLFAEAARVLAPGGELYLCELHPYRQWAGGQAHFIDADSQAVVQVPAFTHALSDYINPLIAAGFRLLHVGEWLEAAAPPGAKPRLVSFHARRETT